MKKIPPGNHDWFDNNVGVYRCSTCGIVSIFNQRWEWRFKYKFGYENSEVPKSCAEIMMNEALE